MYAGILLLNCKNFGAFIIMCSFLHISVLRAAFTGNLELIKVYGEIFMSLLKKQSSKVFNHLTKCDYPIETYVFEAASSMFVNNFPLDVAEKLWDIIMENPELMMMRVGIAVFKALEKSIIDKTKDEIIMMVKRPLEVITEKDLFKVIAKTTIGQKDYDNTKEKILNKSHLHIS